MNVISTGSKALDDLLDGGIKIGMLTDIFGASSSGKTQLCFQVCVNCIKPTKQGGLNGRVLFLDTTSTFRPERIHDIATANGITDNILDNIYVYKIYSSSDHLRAIEPLRTMENVKLVVIDNVTDLFSFEYKQSLSVEKHMKFMALMRELALCALTCQVAVVVTNNMRFGGGEQREDLVRSISTFAHVKLELTKNSGLFQAKLYQPTLESRSEFFRISERGVVDV